jgi:hypothetical protein
VSAITVDCVQCHLSQRALQFKLGAVLCIVLFSLRCNVGEKLRAVARQQVLVLHTMYDVLTCA